MISVYDIGNEAFEKNGNVVLSPTKGSVRMVAGGSLDLTMALTRADAWGAEIVAWVTQAHLKDLISVRKKINYCPMCGRRLSLRDAGREEE